MSNFERIQELFDEALDLSPAKRDDFVRMHCSGDTANEVFALLNAHSGSEEFLTNVFDKLHTVMEDEPAEIPERINHYKIQGLIGEGGMGVVFRAWDEKLHRTVAIKVLSGSRALGGLSKTAKAKDKERFVQEAKAAAQLNHPNVCEVYEINETTEGELYIVTAFCHGEDLAKAVEANRLSYGQLFHIVVQLCDALNSAHKKGIYHRDIKPANIIIDDDNQIRLIDFGIAKISGSDLSQTGQLVGTFSHMAPEQFSGSQIDQRTDIWAIGVLLYQAITGKRPFVGDSAAETMYQIFHGVCPSVNEDDFPLAGRLNQILKRTINLDRNVCFQSVEVLASEIKSLIRELEKSQEIDSIPIKTKPIPSLNTLDKAPLAEYRKVVAMGIAYKNTSAEGVLCENDVLFKEIKRVIKEYKGKVFQKNHSYIYAYFGFPLLREAYADHALACSKNLCALVDDNTQIKVVLDHVSVVMNSHQKTGRQHVVSNISWQCQTFLELDTPYPILLTSSINRRLRKPLPEEWEWKPKDNTWQAEVPRHELTDSYRLFCLPENSDETSSVNYKERYTHALTGRIHELGILEYAWRCTTEGESQTALISGEAGMGKTRLLYELKQRLEIDGNDAGNGKNVTIIECQADPNRTDIALHPIIHALKRHLVDIKRTQKEVSDVDALKLWLNAVSVCSEENFSLLAWMINLPCDAAKNFAASETPEAMHKKCLQFMESCIYKIAAQTPLLLVFEDLHWADSYTLDWLDSLLSKHLDGSIFLVLTGRPELFLRWRSNSAITQLSLNKLRPTEAQDLVSAICLQKTLSDDLKKIIVEKSSGNPLYIEEYTKMLLRDSADTESPKIDSHSIPDTLEDLIHSQLDYLGSSKTLAQAASIIGRVFDASLLPKLLGIDTKSSDQQLSKLIDAGLMYTDSGTNIVFKHALIRDALLGSITLEDRKKLHKNIAMVYEKREDSTNEDVAFHLSMADEKMDAIPWWIRAAEYAQSRNAVVETIRLCRLGIADIQKCVEAYSSKDMDSDFLFQELKLRIVLGPSLIAASNYANAEVGENYRRALELSEQLQEEEQRFASLMGLWSYSCVRAEHRKALDLSMRLVDFAEKHNSNDLRVEAYLARGGTQLFMAELDKASEYLDKAICCYDESMSREHIRLYSQEPSMAIYTFKALLEEARGNGEQAKLASRMSVEAGRRSKHPFSLGFSLAFAVNISLRQQEPALAMALREEYKQLCEEQDIHVFKLLGALQQGIFQIGGGDVKGGIATIEHAIPPYQEFGTGVFVASWYAILAMSYLQLGDAKNALDNLNKGYSHVQKTEENLSLPLLNMIKSQLDSSNKT